MKNFRARYILVFFVVFPMIAFDAAIMRMPESASNQNIVTILARDFPEFYALLEKADMVKTLRDMSPVTVFVPVWYAFRKISPNTLNNIAQDINRVRKLVGMHIMLGRIPSYQLGGISAFPTLTMPVYIQKDGSGSLFVTPSITKSKIISRDIPAKNGVIHVVDSLIMPVTQRYGDRQHEKN